MEEAERLISFTNNSGPLFIVGTVGISMFGDSRTGILLLLTHILSSISVGFLFRFWKSGHARRTSHLDLSSENNVFFSNLGEVLASSIMNSINTILLIGCFIVLFSVVISMLEQSHTFEVAGKILSPLFSFFRIDSKFWDAILSRSF